MKRIFYNLAFIRKLMTMMVIIVIISGYASAQWQIYDAGVLPNENDPSFGTSGLAGNGMVSNIVPDPDNPDNSFLELLTAVNADNGTWRRVFPAAVSDLTIVMKVKSANTDGRRVLELDVDNGGFRERLYINQEDNKIRFQHSTGFGADNEFSLPGNASVQDWNIYRFTKDASGNVKLYINENPVALAEGTTALTTTNNHFRFGDTNGSHNISALIDWIIWDESGAYAPDEGTPVPDGLLPEPVENTWRIYDGRQLPSDQIPVFDESNTGGAGATNQLVTDPEDATNSFLELITVANADNFMWRTPLQPDTDAITMVMKVKAANDVARRVVELDLHHGGLRERLYINREHNRIRLNEAIGGGDGGEIAAPEGVDLGDWNIYRITKSGGAIKVYLNEDSTPIAEGTTTTTSSNQYFRFGDGNGSHNAAALIDWIIWDETGAYAPGQGSIPDPIVTTPWDATLAEVQVDGSQISDFDPGQTEYTFAVPYKSTAVPVISATANDEGAILDVVQAGEIPGQATVVVTAVNGFTSSTYTITFEEAPHNWRMYDASVLPDESGPAFDESNTAGDGATNQLVTDPEDATNSFLELITVANADNFMWRTPLQPDTDAITIVMKVKAANDVARRVVELDLHHAGLRERLYINREHNRIRLNEAIGGGDGGEIPAPEGVDLSDWNIYRITKSGGAIKVYLNEDSTPIAEGTTTTTSSNQYFRFGDGNGSHNAAALVDWIIWDETGAYAPGEGSGKPDPVVTPPWDAALAELKIDGALVSGFDPETLEYTVTLPYNIAVVPEVSAVTNDDEATLALVQAQEIPGQATAVVTAANGFTTRTYVISFEEISHNWRMYDASVLPDESGPAFDESNTAGDGATNQLVTDPENASNSFLELITVANADNFMWRTPLQPDTDAITMVMKVKAANDVARRVVELDLHHGGLRERLYINREDNRIRLNEAIGGGDGGEIAAPDGVDLSDWNIYRITKSGGEIKVYLNEDPEPVAEGTTSTTTTNQYFRFGDGNGSHNAAALVDWIIWDETGAYAPGEGSGIPDPVVTPPWDAALASLQIDGVAIEGFQPDVLTYAVVLPAEPAAIPQISASANHSGAYMVITQATEIPGDATVEVIAENGFTKSTYVISMRRISGNALLATLEVDGVEIEGFDPDVLVYDIELPEGTTEVEVSAEVEDEYAELVITQADQLPGASTIQVTAEDGTVVTYTVNFTFITGINIPRVEKFSIYPNPAQSFIILNRTNDDRARIEIFSTTGKLVLTQMVESANQVIDISNLNEGTYLLRFTSGTSRSSSLFIKQ